MASEVEREGPEAPETSGTSSADVIDYVKVIAAYNARAELTSEHQITLFLKSWWCTTYSRPLKDPLLQEYTFEELLYEFYDKMERQKAAEERATQETDKIEDAKEKEVLDWAEAEEKKELESMQKEADKYKQDPTKIPENIKWMAAQLAKAKEVHGESFGEDVAVDFEE